MQRRTAIALAALAAALVALAVLAGTSLFWRRYLLALGETSELPLAVLTPRERVAGAYQAPEPRVTPALEGLDSQALAAAAVYAAAHGARALLVTHHEHIVFERYWGGTGFDTVEDAQSFTPLLAALATGAALSHRKLGWPAEPLGLLLSAWSHDPRGAITIRDLVKSESGLKPPASHALPWSAGARELFGTDIIAQHLAQPLATRPGTTWVPQRADPDLLARALEVATRERYADYLSHAIWTRIGASDAWLWLDRPGGAAHAECCMLARQGDWIRVAELLVHDGNYRGAEVIHPGWIAQMLQPVQGAAGRGSYVRLGGPGSREPYATSVIVVGGEGGNRLWAVPALQLAIVLMARRPERGENWDDTRIPNLIIRGSRDYVPARPTPGEALRMLVPGH